MESLFNFSTLFCFISSIIFFIIFLYSAYIFYTENEKRAAFLAFSIGILLPIPYFTTWYYNYNILALILFADIILTGLLFIYPFKTPTTICDGTPLNKIDERDVMFSRNELIKGSENYNNYYTKNPEKEDLNNTFRKEAGLCSEKSLFNRIFGFAAAHASFFADGQFKNAINRDVNPNRKKSNPEAMSSFIKILGKEIRRFKMLGIASLKITIGILIKEEKTNMEMKFITHIAMPLHLL